MHFYHYPPGVVFPLQSKTNGSQVKAQIFLSKALIEVGPLLTVELLRMRSSFEIGIC